jgi:plasmid stabilization system protein ParE
MANSPAFSIVFTARAHRNITETWSWYEDRQRGLGDRFVKELENRLQKIAVTPERFPIRTNPFRESPVPVFPYLIIYRVIKRSKIIRVIAVFHTSLNPKKKY